MKRTILWAAIVAAILLTSVVYGLNIKAGFAVQSGADTGTVEFLWTGATKWDVPAGVTVFTGDESSFYLQRAFAGTYETVPAKIPGSILIPTPVYYNTDSTRYEVKIQITGHSDSLWAYGWSQ